MTIRQIETAAIPYLTELMAYMLGCNDMVLSPRSEWPDVKAVDYTLLEQQASSLSEEEREVLADGEEMEALDIVNNNNCIALHRFLNEVFDGTLTDAFVVPVK